MWLKKTTLAVLLFLVFSVSGSWVVAGSASAETFDPLKTICTGKSADPSQPDIKITGDNASNTAVCQDQAANKDVKNPVIKALKLAITILSYIIGVAAVIMIIIGGFNIIKSNGDAQAVAKARQTILYAIIGVVIVVLAQTLVAFVLNKL